MNLINLLRLYDTWDSSKCVADATGMDGQEERAYALTLLLLTD
jgi:hypothetical protein